MVELTKKEYKRKCSNWRAAYLITQYITQLQIRASNGMTTLLFTSDYDYVLYLHNIGIVKNIYTSFICPSELPPNQSSVDLLNSLASIYYGKSYQDIQLPYAPYAPYPPLPS